MKPAVLVPFFALLAAVAIGGCQRAGDAVPSASAAVESNAPSATTTQVVPAPAKNECGGQCGGGGACGGSCGDHAALPTAPAKAIPADAVWTELKVSGMSCGRCANRVRSALASIDGLYGVEVDVASATVKIAVAPGKDLRAESAAKIDALGYRVVN